MSQSAGYREIISFCQMLSVSLRSGHSIPDSLSALAGRTSDSISSKWARQLSTKLAEGYPVEEACRELAGFDPVLARLLPLIGQNRLIKILEIYTTFLVNLETVRENLKTVLFYPMVVILLLVANLLQLNFGLFPRVYEQLVAAGSSIPWLMKLLYFAEFRLWPFSLPLPVILVAILAVLLRGMYAGQINSSSLIARLARVGLALRLQEQARLQGIISLYLRAGFSLVKAVEVAADFALPEDRESLSRAAEALSHGEKPGSAFAVSPVLANLLGEDEEPVNLPEKLQYVADSNNRHSASILKKISTDMFIAALLLTGIFVALITSGVFDSYYWVIWSFT